MKFSPRLSVVLLVATSLGLVACGSSDEASVASSTTEPSADAAPTAPTAESTPASEPPASEPPASEPPTTVAPDTVAPDTVAPDTVAPDDGAGPDCLIGTWVITQDEMNAYYDAVEAQLASAGPAPTFDIVGQTFVAFRPGEYQYSADFDLTVDVVGQSGTGRSGGTVTGTWTGDDGLLTTELVSSDLSVSITVGGITIDGSDLANGILNDVPLNGAPYDCAGPSIDFATGGEGSPRHTVTLTRA